MTTTSARPDSGMLVRVSDPAQLIAAVPHLLGFRPADSVVVLGLGGASGQRIDPVLRADLPSCPGEEGAAERLAAVFAQHSGRAVVIVIVGRGPGDPPGPGCLPYEEFVSGLGAALRRRGRPVDRALWTPEIQAGAPWASYGEPGRAGVVPDNSSSQVAAAAASMGFVTFESRAALEGQLDPDDPAALARRERLLEAEMDTLAARVVRDPGCAESFQELRMALDQARYGPPKLSDEQMVRLGLALFEGPVRDTCLAAALPAGSERSMRAEALWLALVRGLPAPERAEPAALLGHSAYVRGDGVLARAALENALAACPAHTLAELLMLCLELALPPDRLSRLHHPGDLGKLFGPPT
ncbi:MAG TPA: DUF4192 domain-containing protein [Amycolatopsis sp.]|uniref:DUF4192 domain-containing protein n=1 Tax=Amycolatopsis sp. TaxID=37632 RepID=UPI002B45A59B|nr:DUF4192 domain-containing protein [Amycolatopsis sp.]HKS48661.1 DUF4192 domain-containing protein [Amycolatopsis sp.]